MYDSGLLPCIASAFYLFILFYFIFLYLSTSLKSVEIFLSSWSVSQGKRWVSLGGNRGFCTTRKWKHATRVQEKREFENLRFLFIELTLEESCLNTDSFLTRWWLIGCLRLHNPCKGMLHTCLRRYWTSHSGSDTIKSHRAMLPNVQFRYSFSRNVFRKVRKLMQHRL